MNEYLFYTTEGETIAPNQDVDVENCQLLGFSKGENKDNALILLLSNNPWIIESGFDPSKINVVQIVSPVS